jgi:hypothetical protein
LFDHHHHVEKKLGAHAPVPQDSTKSISLGCAAAKKLRLIRLLAVVAYLQGYASASHAGRKDRATV